MRNSKIAAALAAGTMMGAAYGQPVVMTRWDFNNVTNLTSPAASLSNGTTGITIIGGAGGAALVSSNSGVVSSDPTQCSTCSWSITNFPLQGGSSGSAGVEYRTATTGYSNVFFEFDYRCSNTFSNWYNLEYSTNGGGAWVAIPGGPFEVLGTSFINNSNGVANGSSTLALPAAADNLADVRVRLVTVHDPLTPGTFAPNSVGSTYGATGTIRFDMVEFWGTTAAPIPPSGFVASRSPLAHCSSTGGLFNIQVQATAGQNPVSTQVFVTADLTSVGGAANAGFLDVGGGLFTLDHVAPINVAPGTYTIPVTIFDNDGPGGSQRSTSTSTTLGIGDCAASSSTHIVISSVYTGGGSTQVTPTFAADYVELHNRGCEEARLIGDSLQYASQSNNFSLKINLPSIVIPAGGYYLVQTFLPAVGALGGPIAPAPDFVVDATTGNFNMQTTSAKVALVEGQTLLVNGSSPGIIDMVGFGFGASFFEGAGPAPAGNTDNALLRDDNGCQDSNENFNDFAIGAVLASPNNAASAANICATCVPVCVADFDDGSATGTPDGGVDISDLLFFLALFDAGDIGADVDDGSSTGTPDGGVDISDLLYFLFRFDAGC